MEKRSVLLILAMVVVLVMLAVLFVRVVVILPWAGLG
jgi:hypothetical protein